MSMQRAPTGNRAAAHRKRRQAAADVGAHAEAVRASGSRSPPQYVDVEGVTDPDAFALVVDGDSMQPEYLSGEVLIFSRAAPVRSGDDCLVVFYHPAWGLCERFKRVFLEAGGSVRLQALNPRYGTLTLEARRVLAVIRAVARVPAAAGARPAAAGHGRGRSPARAERFAPPAKIGGQAGEARSRSARSEKSPCLTTMA